MHLYHCLITAATSVIAQYKNWWYIHNHLTRQHNNLEHGHNTNLQQNIAVYFTAYHKQYVSHDL